MNTPAFQLYSARNTPLPTALQVIADAGYTEVEAYKDNVQQPVVFQTELQNSGLSVVSLHVGLDELQNNMLATLELAAMLDINHIVCPYLLVDQRPVHHAGWLKLAGELADINAQISATGRDFAWHNHDFEFVALADGSIPMRLLLDGAPDMHWQMDIGWIQRISESPASWLRTYGDRISAVHLKDVAKTGACDDEDGWADVGYGTVDWQEIIPELNRCDTDLFIIEHDNPSDLARFATRSFKTVDSWK